jgi:hypothetical protein
MTVEISTADCDFIKANRALYISAQDKKFYRGFPKNLIVHSADTGRAVHFTPIREGHPRFDYDFWDGEMAIYEPVTALRNVDILVISYGM